MSGGFLISLDDGMFRRAAEVLAGQGAVASVDALGDKVTQLSDNVLWDARQIDLVRVRL